MRALSLIPLLVIGCAFPDYAFEGADASGDGGGVDDVSLGEGGDADARAGDTLGVDSAGADTRVADLGPVDDVDGTSGCTAPSIACSGRCVDVGTDAANCGACGHVCGGGERCSAGACAGTCAKTLCAGACVDTASDANNCGSCGTVCATGQTCAGGTCTCAVGSVSCGGSCTDLGNDSVHCGSCTADCGSASTGSNGSYCAAGGCMCLPGRGPNCAGTCTARNDPRNCGGCGVTCTAAEVCSSASCQPASVGCPAGEKACPFALTASTSTTGCLAVDRDVRNCGDCGNACLDGQLCIKGACALYAPAVGCASCPCPICAAFSRDGIKWPASSTICCPGLPGQGTAMCVLGASCPVF